MLSDYGTHGEEVFERFTTGRKETLLAPTAGSPRFFRRLDESAKGLGTDSRIRFDELLDEVRTHNDPAAVEAEYADACKCEDEIRAQQAPEL